MTAYLYLRVSTEEQVSNLSLDTQEQECRALCERNDWKVAAVFREEGASAKTLERPAMQRMLAQLGRDKGKVTHVVILRVDRLTRDRDDFYLIRHAMRRHKVRIVSVREEIADDSISSMIVETFSVLQAQVDNLIRAGRAKTGMTEAARRGRWVWKAPIGYRHAPHRDGRAVGLEPDPEQAPLIARAFDLVGAGVAVDAAYRTLVAEGLKNDAGKPPGRQTFHAIFRRALYAGRLEVASWGVEVASAAPAIVTEDAFARAQAAIATRTPMRHHTPTLEQFPLRGATRCACGRKMVAYHARGKGGGRWPYYRCQRCKLHVASRDLGDAFERLLGRLTTPEPILTWIDRHIGALAKETARTHEERATAARKRIATADKRIDRLMGMRMDGELSAEEFAAGKARVVAERDRARVELASLVEPHGAQAALASKWVRSLLAQPIAAWQELAPHQRTTFVERVFPEGLTYSEGELSNPANCLLALAPSPISGEGKWMVRQPQQTSNPEQILANLAGLARLDQELFGRAA